MIALLRQKMSLRGLPLLVFCLLGFCSGPASSSPWLDVGDASLRSDVELLAAHGLIDGISMTWPIPARQLERGLSDTDRLKREPADVRAAANRVLAALARNASANELRPLADLQATNRAEVIRGFDASARNEIDLRGGGELNSESASVRLLAGEQTAANGDDGRPSLDGSTASLTFGNVLLYAGWIDRWFGPGWTSALSLSNNARSFPKIGLMRADTQAFESLWLHWIGPWQVDFFVGDLDGPRTDRNTLFGSLRLDFSPFHGFEIALSRLTEFCGDNHPCDPVNAAFHFGNSDGNANKTNDEATIDLKYTAVAGALTFSPYAQFMNEDTDPFTHSYTSYLGGASVAGPLGDSGTHWRVTTEYTDTVATLNWFDFGKLDRGGAYNNGGYTDGFRYRDRTLGFSLDSDSRLFSLAAQFLPSNGWRWRGAYYHGTIGSSQLAESHAAGSSFSNVVSVRPVTLDEAEVGLSIPWKAWTFDMGLRAADAQPYPRSGGIVAGELGLRYGF